MNWQGKWYHFIFNAPIGRDNTTEDEWFWTLAWYTGWLLNLLKACQLDTDNIHNFEFFLRSAGAVLFPIGSFLGYCSLIQDYLF